LTTILVNTSGDLATNWISVGQIFKKVRKIPSHVRIDRLTGLLAVESIHVPQSDAKRIWDPTVPIWNMTGEYMIGVEVFHQLHCLVRSPERANALSIFG
jgi:hypothetical protein